jgi:hypothetical protein
VRLVKDGELTKAERILEAKIRHVTLEMFEHHVQWAINPELLRLQGPLRSMWADEYLMRLTAYVWCRVDNEERHEYPTTWWDAVKQRWFPKWALRRWPVSVTVVTVKRGVIYPEFAPKSGPGVSADRMHVAVYGPERAE